MILRNITFKYLKAFNMAFDKKCMSAVATNDVDKSLKVKTRKRTKSTNKPSQNIKNFFDYNGNSDVLNKFPEIFLKKTHKAPDIYYIANEDCAKTIAECLTHNLPDNCPIIEINPGPGLLTHELLKKNIKSLHLFESDKSFEPMLNVLEEANKDVVKITYGDFIRQWKLVLQDSIDDGNRMINLLFRMPTKEWHSGINARLFGVTSSSNFFKYLISSIVFQSGFLAYGKCEMYIAMAPQLFYHLTCTKDAGYFFYRATSILFQIFFEYEYIKQLPREAFLPWQFETNVNTKSKTTHFNTVDLNYLYLVKIVPRSNLAQLCLPEHLPKLWFFVKQSCFSRSNKVIPTMEQWIPNSGMRLILNPRNHTTDVPLKQNLDLSELLPYFKPCLEISSEDYYQNMSIFTEFGELTPSQILTLFNQFINWPEFQECSFTSYMDINLTKWETHGKVLDMEEDEAIEENMDKIDV